MKYRILAEALEKLEKTASYLEKNSIIADLLKRTPSEEMERVVLLLLGRPWPAYVSRETGVGLQQLKKAVARASGYSITEVDKFMREKGDLGEVARQLMAKKKQFTFFAEELTIEKVFGKIKQLPDITGEGSVDRKIDSISELLTSSKPIEAKFIVRTVLGDLRIGVAEGRLRDAIATAFNLSPEKIEHAYMLTTDYSIVAKVAAEGGDKGLERLGVEVGHPVNPMLAQRAEDIAEILKRMGGKAAFEVKLDGIRCVPHDTIVFGECIPIEKIRKGDIVASNRGFTRVTEVYDREYEGKMKEVNIRGITYSITPEHPIIVHPLKNCYYRRGSKKKYYCRKNCGQYPGQKCPHEPAWSGQWKKAGDLNDVEYLEIPKIIPPREDFDVFLRVPVVNKWYIKQSPRKTIKFDDAFLKLLGWFITEGTSTTKYGTISFSLHVMEKKSCKEIMKLFESKFNRKLHYRIKKEKGVELYCRSRDVAEFLSSLCGSKSREKRIPFLSNLSKRQRKILLETLMRGDGTIKHKSYTTNSKILAYQVFEILLSLGVLPSISQEGGCFRINFRRNDKKGSNYFETDHSFIVRARIRDTWYKGKVYNLETESQTYLIPNVVHNCQVHKNGDEIALLTRRMENYTGMFPDMIGPLRKALKPRRVIVDGELVATDRHTGKPMPFQEVLKRRRKYEIKEAAEQIPVQVQLFDVLLVENRTMLDEPYVKRRAMLERIVEEVKGKVGVVEQRVLSDPSEIQKFLDKSLKIGHEGLLAKDLESSYRAGRREFDWLKLKPTLETLDLVVVGAHYGKGKRAGVFGSYILAARDEDDERFKTVTRCGSGFTDEDLKDLTKMFKKIQIKKPHEDVDIEIEVDAHFEPKVVFEIAYEEIQLSPEERHTSKMGLRFPRFVRVRQDRRPEEITTVREIEELFDLQERRKGKRA